MFDHMTWVERDLAPVFERFAALVEGHLKSQGYRQCAVGQKTTQFCGMLEEAVKAERHRICEMLRERHKQEDRHNYYGFIANMIEEMP